MSRPLVVSFLLLAAVANAGAVKYDCGFTTGCDDCLINKDVEAKETVEFGKCKSKEVDKDTVYFQYVCNEDGGVKEVRYYDDKCKIRKDSVEPTDYQCKSPENNDDLASAKLAKGANEELALTYCTGTVSCKDESDKASCLKGTIKNDAMSGDCTKGDGFSFKATKLAAGDYVLSISGYSGDSCAQEKLLFQGVFVADDQCTPLAKRTKYVCDAAAHYTLKTCGMVQSCGDCTESTEISTAIEDMCMNSSTSSTNYSYRNTCSGGKLTYTTYSDPQCNEMTSAKTTESCFLEGAATYVKLAGGSIYTCDTLKDCQSENAASRCYKTSPSGSLITDGSCVYDKKGFSYKATQNGNKYRLAIYTVTNKCDKNLQLQGEFGEECVLVRKATKTECSGSFAIRTVVVASVIAVVMSVLF